MDDDAPERIEPDEGDPGRALVVARYEPRLVEALRALPGRRWLARRSAWSVPLSPDGAWSLRVLAEAASLAVDPDVADALAAAVAERDPERPCVEPAGTGPAPMLSVCRDWPPDVVRALCAGSLAAAHPLVGRISVPLVAEVRTALAELVGRERVGLAPGMAQLLAAELPSGAVVHLVLRSAPDDVDAPPGPDHFGLAFPYRPDVVAAVKRIRGRRFDWDQREWVLPARPRTADALRAILAEHPWLRVAPDAEARLRALEVWEGRVTLGARDGAPAFLLLADGGRVPEALAPLVAWEGRRGLAPMTDHVREQLRAIDGAQLDDLATAALDADPAQATLATGRSDGERIFVLEPGWDRDAGEAFAALPGSARLPRPGVVHLAADAYLRILPADVWAVECLDGFLAANPGVELLPDAHDLLAELRAEHERAVATVARSRARDAELEVPGLVGTLEPFQRAGVAYALERRRCLIADEQGLGKTIEALATLQADGAFPAVVVCPASLKLTWEREARAWLPQRTVAVVTGRRAAPPEADIVVLNYELVAAHAEALLARAPRALVLDESHFVKNPRARRTRAVHELADGLPEDALRLALSGTPVLNRPEELIAQLRALDRLSEFGSGARFTRRFKAPADRERLHWLLRSRCFVRRTKAEVLDQLPPKRRVTVPLSLDNAADYAAAERDVIGWLQRQPADLRSIDARVAAALRAEQLVRLGELRRLAALGKRRAALGWVADFLAGGEPLVLFARLRDVQRAALERFPDALHVLGGDTPAQRDAAVRAFQGGAAQLIVCSLEVASQGFTLTHASNVCFLELDWTPARHEQAEDRCHRIGQHDTVCAHYLLAADTIDETMAMLLERKRTVVGAVTDGTRHDEQALVSAVVDALRAQPPRRHLRAVA